jgi:predicted MFS family arabinose efflux permease
MLGALSLTALVFLDASAVEMGLLAMAQGVPVLLFALFAGVWIDRVRRRPVLVAADAGRAALLVTVPLAAVFDSLTMAQMYGVAFGVGLLELAFGLAYRSYLPAVVERSQLHEGNSRLSASESVAEVAAPAAGGAIVQAAGGPVAVLVDALTFVWSAAFVAAIQRSEPERPRTETNVLADIADGLRFLWRDRLLRAMVLAGGTFRFFGGFWAALYGVFLIRVLDLSPLLTGITIGAGGAGSLAGALFAGNFARRLGYGRSLVISRVLITAISALVPLATGPQEAAFIMILAAQAAGDPFWTVYEIGTTSLRQSITPEGFLGRVNSAMHVVESGLQPLGALAGGLLAASIGVREAIWVAVFGGALGIVWLLASPLPGLRTLEAEPVKVE